tara:strand:+ start:202 stop:372 length:171 start_codon:yes stop_codon:yes gene_type:complete
MILLRYLKAEFEKRATCRCDCDGYRAVSFQSNVRIYFKVFLWEHMFFYEVLAGQTL